MINNNDVVKVMKIRHHMYEQYLSNNVLDNAYVKGYTITLLYLFGLRYGTFQQKHMPFEANLVERG